MNVAPTITAPSPSTKGDPTAAAVSTARMLPDGSGSDLPVDATQGDTFGRLLSRGMAGLDEVLQGKAVRPLSLPTEPGVVPVVEAASDPSATPTDPADRSRGFGVVVNDLVDLGAATVRSAKTTDDGTEDAVAAGDGGRHDDAAVVDLAAQLALVSQWAAIAKAPAAPDAPGDSPDLRDKLATVRGTASPITTSSISSTSRTAATPVGPLADPPQDVSALPFAPGPTLGKAERVIDVGKPSTATVKADPPAAHATDGVRATIETAGIAEPGTVRAPVDATVAPTGAFAQQIAAATSATATTIAAPVSTEVPPVPSLNIREHFGTPAWSREVGQATLRIATSDVQSATLQINPEHLGPVDVQVRIDNGIAHLSFNAAHADTRQALESSRATLDRLFTDQGLKIGDCAVGDSSTPRRNADADASLSGQSQRNGSDRRDQATGGNAAADHGPATTLTTRLKALGLVDTFA